MRTTSSRKLSVYSGRKVKCGFVSSRESGQPHWSRAAVLGVLGRQIRIKPIKHGGREEIVPIADIKLWKAMNSKQVTKET